MMHPVLRCVRALAAMLAMSLLLPLGSRAAEPDTTDYGLPRGYPRSYSALVESGRSEGLLRLYAAGDTFDLTPLIRDFRSLHPQIAVDYQNLHTAQLYHRFLTEVSSGTESADLLISSAMDLQTKLVNDGYAQAYNSPEKPQLPDWAVWKNEAYSVSVEPIVIVYNQHLLKPEDVPMTRADLEQLLRRRGSEFNGKISLYDPAQSSAGYLYLTQDIQASLDIWDLLRAIGRTQPRLSTSGSEILSDISSGKALLAYNMNGGYALERKDADPAIGVAFPRDYTLVMSRIALISREARHPAAARLFLDYLLSLRGQALLEQHHMTPVRLGTDVGDPWPDSHSLRAIKVGPALLVNMDQIKQRRLLRDLDAALQGK